jgi:hypothetical protein
MLISSLLYIMLSIKVDIAYVVIKLARYASNPNNTYFIAVKRLYKYLKGIKDYNITYYKNKNYFISGYCDADYASDIKTAKSTNSYLILYARSIIS